MNATLLIHSIVRQTMVLIAALATASGQRTPLTNIADQVFSSLVEELGGQGLGNKVIADMLGLALRTYHRRVARLSGSETEEGRSLWGAVLAHVRDNGPISRRDVFRRFHADDELVVRSVLRDLVDSGLVYLTGRGDAVTYRGADAGALSANEAAQAADQVLLIAIHQNGPLTVAAVNQLVPLGEREVREAASRLVAQGLVAEDVVEGESRLRCEEAIVPLGAAAGWEAAVFDHYLAMVTAIVTKLRVGARRSDLSDKVGGSTFTFDVWGNHPLRERALDYLKTMREQGMSLRAEIDAFNKGNPKPENEPSLRVIAYVGQTVRDEGEDDACT